MEALIPLILFVLLGIGILIAFEVRARKDAKEGRTPEPPKPGVDGECCGQHLVCERETLLQTNAKPEYYDDEELDALAGIPAKQYTPAQCKQIQDVFDTLQEKDVAGWVRSLQLRNIELPAEVREEALLIVCERRKH